MSRGRNPDMVNTINPAECDRTTVYAGAVSYTHLTLPTTPYV